MLKFGILRSPSGYSLSEAMQTAALQYLNINGEYKAYGVKPEELKKVFESLKANNINGLNVTIPHKVNIIPLIDELTETANLVGAVNTVTFNSNRKSTGDNTDVIGFWEAIPEEIRKEIPNKTISVFGCGGAARAVCRALILNNAKKISVYGRNKNKLDNFKNHFTVETSHRGVSTVDIDLLNNIDLSNTSMLINTTPLGMFPDTNKSPILIEDLKKMKSNAFVYDIIYKPQETKLLKDAKSLNLKTLNGVEMLVRQGAASLNIWLGKNVAPISVMRMAVLESLEDDASLRGA